MTVMEWFFLFVVTFIALYFANWLVDLWGYR